ncbi:hypothetical protein MBSD_n1438 [Mizugakiibacter sediminis]|uniref:Thymidine phosphorylase n=2 Tax=Mizugakiibacter sediminis TaxID=1475481 RepID=A0A0K8QN69_9GAMM|nr:hypothetical protein MBSD_n1438 [Mizugakiibacter sediminis]
MASDGRTRNEPSSTAPPTLAARTDLPPRVRQLLDELLEMCSARLEPALRATLSDFEQQLFKHAEQARNNAEQQRCFDSLREVKRGRADVAPRFLLALEEQLAALDRTPASGHGVAADALKLVDQRELEEALALEDIATRAEVRCSVALYELGHRFGVLIAAPLIEAEALPLGPYAITGALQRAAADLELSLEHKLLLYRSFDRRVMAAAGAFYDGLNQHLAARGILTQLRVFLPKRAQDGKAAAPAPQAGGAAPGAVQPGAPVVDAARDEESFARLRELLAQRRTILGLAGEDGGDGHVASGDELQAVLAGLQNRPPLVKSGGRMVPRTMQHLRQDLLAHLRQFSPGGQPPRLAAQHRDTLDLVGMLFEHLGKEVPLGGHAEKLLTRLQVPLLRVALSDPSFFTQRAHPARRLLNTLVETAANWIDSSDGEADPTLVEKMRLLVDRVLNEYTGDLGLFEQLLGDLDRHMSMLARKAESAERRHVEAAQGRERLQTARMRASAAIAERLAGARVAPLVRTMLEQAWTDALALSILRHGEDSRAYRERLAIAERLVKPGAAEDKEELRREIERGLGQVGLHDADAAQVAQRVVEGAAANDDEAPASQTELALRLKQRQRLGEELSVPAPAPTAAVQATLDLEEKRMLERLKTLPFGTWFEFVRSPGGETVRRKLAWYSTLTGRCLFVNQRGARCDERSLDQLARDMRSGAARLVPAEQESLIDRAWNAITAALRQFAGRSAVPAQGGAGA